MATIAIFSGYHIPHLGGIERYTDNLSKELIKKGHKVVIISSDYQFLNKNIIEKENEVLLTIPVRKIFVSRYPIPKRNKAYKEVIKYLDSLKIDAIIVNTRFHLTSLVGAKYGNKHGIPVYLIEHGSMHLTVDNKILDYLGAHYEHGLTAIIKKYVNHYYGVSKGACDWQKHFKITSDGVWYNSINDFSKDYNLKKSNKKIVFLYAGRILKQKGIKELVSSFNKLSGEFNNIELNIAGEGNFLSELKKDTRGNKKIHFLGKLDFKQLCKEYEKANVFVYATKWPEGLPTSVLEAGLMNCAIISSPQGGNKEIVIDNETGLMVNTEKELYDAMKKLIIDEKLRNNLAKNVRSKVLKEFIWPETCKKIIKDLKIRSK